MLVLKIIAAAGILLLGSGCTSKPSKVTEAAPVVDESIIEQEKESEVETAIDKDVLYLLLTAEIAGQRKRYDVAMEGYLRAARKIDDARVSERAAKIAIFLKDEKKTNEAVDLWLKQNPENLTARKVAVLAACRAENQAEALEHLNYLLELDPAGFEGTLLEQVKILESEGKGAFVYDVLDEMFKQHPGQAAIPFVQALMAMQMGQLEEAADKVQLALNIQPDWGRALVLQAQLAAQSGDLIKAKTILQKAVDNDPENESLRKLQANILLKAGDHEAASEVYLGLLDQNPDDEEVQYTLALLYLQMHENEKAEALFYSLVDQPRSQSQASFYLGRLAAEKGEIDKSLIWFDKVTNGPLVLESGLNAVSVLIENKRYDEALERLESLKGRSPKQRYRFVLMEAELYNAQKQYGKAFDLLTDVLEDMPEQKELLYTRALVAERLDKLDVLEADLKLILEQEPDDANALNALGYTLVDRTDRLEEAERYLQRAIELKPDSAVIIDSYGWLLFRQGKLEESLQYLQRAYKEQKEGEIAAHLVEVLWDLGKKNEARKIYNQAIKNVRDPESLIKLQQRLPGLNQEL